MDKVGIKKILLIIICVLVLGTVSTIVYPSFSRLLTNDVASDYWNGASVSTSLSGSGTEESPYLLQSGADVAYFVKHANSDEKYASAYYKFTNDIYLNKGSFDYQEAEFKYYRDNVTYYIDRGQYYNNSELSESVGTINTLDSINSFSGIIDGDGFTLHGLYIDTEADAYFINNFTGSFINLKIDNAYIGGVGHVGFINHSNHGFIDRVSFNGVLKNGSRLKSMQGVVSDEASSNNLTLTLKDAEVPVYASVTNYELTGNTTQSFTIDGAHYDSGQFVVAYSEPVSTVLMIGEQNWRYLWDILPRYSNLRYTSYYYDDITGFIVSDENTNISNSVMKGNLYGNNVAGSFIGVGSASSVIQNSYNLMDVNAKYMSGGFIGYSNHSNLTITTSYNNGNVTSEYIAGGIVGMIHHASATINMRSVFDWAVVEGTLSGGIIGSYQDYSNLAFEKVYYIENNSYGIKNENMDSIIQVNSTVLNTRDYFIHIMGFEESGTSISTTAVWVIEDGSLPYFDFDDRKAPLITIKYNGNHWTSEESGRNILRLELDKTGTVIVSVDDVDSDILKVEYYLHKMNTTDKMDFDSIHWQLYTTDISITKNSFYTVYVKAMDTAGNISYAFSDLMILDGYTASYSEGITNQDITEYSKLAANSVINIDYKHNVYADVYPYPMMSKSMIESNSKLPVNTIVYLYDKLSKDTYKYVVNDEYIGSNDKYYYDLGNFVSVRDNSSKYNNVISNYYRDYEVNEEFELSYDFSNISNDTYTFHSSVVVMNDDRQVECRSVSGSREVDIYKYDDTTKYDLNLKLEYSGVLDLSVKDNTFHIKYSIRDGLNLLNGNPIYDPDYFNKKYMMKIEVLNALKQKVTNKFINNLSYTVGEETYVSKKDGVSYIPIGNLEDTLSVKVKGNYNDVLNGDYYLRITVYNNYNSDNNFISEDVLAIVTNGRVLDAYSFGVAVDSTDKFLIRSTKKTQSGSGVVPVKILYHGEFVHPKLKVKLYWKDNLTVGSSFEPVSVNEYFNNHFDSYRDHWFDISNLSNHNYVLELIPNYGKLVYGTYKISLGLYDGDNFITEEEFNIIVK